MGRPRSGRLLWELGSHWAYRSTGWGATVWPRTPRKTRWSRIICVMTIKQSIWPLFVMGLLACGSEEKVQPTVPAALEPLDGNGQSGGPGALLAKPLTVKVTDAQGNPVPGVLVSWSVLSGAGTVTPSSSASDDAGAASAQFTLGPDPGEQQARAEVSGLSGSPVIFTATAASGNTGAVVLSVVGGGNNVPERLSSDLWVHGNYAYTGTWGYHPGSGAAGDALNVWTLSASGAPSLVDSVIVPGIATVSDVQVSDDGQLLVLSGERGGDFGQDGGIYIYSLTDPAHPSFLGAASTPFGGTHTVTLSSINGQLYAFAAKNPGFNGTSKENEPALMIYSLT